MVQSWAKRGTTLDAVLDALPELRRQASAREAGTRTAVMTLVMVSRNEGDVEYFAASARSLGAHHPCRVVLLEPDPDSTPAIDATTCLWRAQPPEGEGHPVFFEEIRLRVGGQAASHLASIVGPFVLADLPTVMWFPWHLPDPADPLLQLASAILVDTRDVGPDAPSIGHSYRTLLELANRCPVVDLSWVRLQPWRELLAGLFEPEHSRAFLAAVGRAEVTGKPGPRHMLGGWLMAQLDLRARELVLTDAKHVDITLEAHLAEQQGTFQVHRDESTRAVWAKATISGGPSHSQALPLPDDSLTSALAAAISNLRADRVWERALAAAAAIAS
ncbi:MAG TPA: glucose-6-phosphate dehydrogenase assembly protein OpcA [Acidimicrobiales bacterium]|nr:glucose-6-phosphate dehydrogenase assembly protein OpcA [Acidimicrobiales bacterium]